MLCGWKAKLGMTYYMQLGCNVMWLVGAVECLHAALRSSCPLLWVVDGRIRHYSVISSDVPFLALVYFASVGGRSIATSVYVCLSVCFFVCLFVWLCLSAGISQKPVSNFRVIFCAYCMWSWLSLYLTAMRYVMYFRFCG